MPSRTKATASTSERTVRLNIGPGRGRIEIKPAVAGNLPEVRKLFREYEEFIETDLCFQNFEQELAGLPGPYAKLKGRLLMAWHGKEASGCVALRKFQDDICEMKRLFVRPQFQGRGLGRRLAWQIIREACRIGYREMRLDTLPKLKPAIAIYESLGFKRIPPYHDYANKEILFMALKLKPA